MDLRSASFEILQKELKPFIELAVERHPQVIDIKVKRGNVVTAHDYARRILIKARKQGIGKYSADEIKALKPRLRIYFCKEGIAVAGLKQKIKTPAHWDNYKLPFKALPPDDARWVTLVVNPSKEEVQLLMSMLVRSIFESPIELRTKFTLADLKEMAGTHANQIHFFRTGRNTMLWPKRTEES